MLCDRGGNKGELFIDFGIYVNSDVIERVNIKDPVTGVWHVQKSNNGVIWCDASSLALAVLLEINGAIVKDAAWLRKKDDFNDINEAELEAVQC